MDLKRYFRGPFVAVLVMLLLFFIVFTYANRGTSYTQKDTSYVVQQIEKHNVKSAVLTDKNQTIQIVTKSTASTTRRAGSATRGSSWPPSCRSRATCRRTATTSSSPAATRCWA